MTAPTPPISVTYDIDSRPPLQIAVPLALQHVLVMMASNVSLPLVLATAIGMTTTERAFLVQVALLVAGITTLVQTIGMGRIGSRLPVVQGTSSGFLIVSIPLAQQYGISAVFGGAVFAGLVQMALGFGLKWLKKLFPPLVSGVVMLVIGIGLIPVGLGLFGGGAESDDFGSPTNLALAGLVTLVILVAYRYGRGVINAASVLVGLIVGYLTAVALGLVDFGPVADAAWFSIPMPLKYGISLPAAALVSMGIMAIATSVETIGHLTALTKSAAGRDITHRELEGGVVADGFSTAFASLFSALPNTTFAQNVGLVTLTGVLSRFVVSLGGVFLIVLGLFPKLATVIAVMPPSVIGGAGVVMFGMVLASGVKLIADAPIDRHDLLVIAVSVGLGQGFALVPDVTAGLPASVSLIINTGLAPAVLFAVVMNLVRPRTDEGGFLTQVDSVPSADLGKDSAAGTTKAQRVGTENGQDPD